MKNISAAVCITVKEALVPIPTYVHLEDTNDATHKNVGFISDNNDVGCYLLSSLCSAF